MNILLVLYIENLIVRGIEPGICPIVKLLVLPRVNTSDTTYFFPRLACPKNH